MNRYYVFSTTSYYPEGGMDDCVLRTNNLTRAIGKALVERDEKFRHASVWDVEEEKYVELPDED